MENDKDISHCSGINFIANIKMTITVLDYEYIATRLKATQLLISCRKQLDLDHIANKKHECIWLPLSCTVFNW